MKINRVFALLAVFLTVFSLLAGCGEKKAGSIAEPTQAPSLMPTEVIDESPDAEATFRRSTLYFLSDDGYIVPVTKLIPWEEGVAKACLSYMIGSEANDTAAAELGLNTVIPAGTALSISIADGNALVDLAGMPTLGSAERELFMIEAVVNTLTEFPTVSTVTITRDGKGGTLENGTELPVRHGKYPLNPEKTELSVSAGAEAATLFFPNISGSLTVPVTRYTSKSPSLYTLVSALIEGSESRGLMNCFPENTLLLGAALEGGTVTVNLSEDFKAAAKTEGMYSLAVRTLWLTLKERFDFERLKIQVNGVDYAPEEAEIPLAVNMF